MRGMPPTRDDLAWARRWRRLLARDWPRLAAISRSELDRPEFETLMSDVVPLLDACRWHEKHARRVLRTKRIGGGGLWRVGQRHSVRHLPLGHVAIIATWNYPYQLLGVQVLQAVLAGNRVTVKPSERSPGAHGALLGLAREAGLDESRLRWTEATREAGRDLLEFGQFDHVVFTGSTPVGKRIAATLAETLTPSTLELTGSDSAIVLGDADSAMAAKSVYLALAMNAGQSCMAPRRVIVEEAAYDAFVSAFRPMFTASHTARRLGGEEAALCGALVSQARTVGAEVAGASAALEPGAFSPTAVLACPEGADIVAGEHFGPAIAVVRSRSRAQTMEMAQSSMKSLATSIFTRDIESARALGARLDCGFVTINDCLLPTAHPGVSIAGRGMSGWGISRGELGLLEMTRPQFVSTTSGRFRVPTGEPSERVQQNIGRFVHWWYGR